MHDMPVDSTTIERDGIEYNVALYPDYDISPKDYDGYSPSDREAFDRGDWLYVGVVVTPNLPGTDGDGMDASRWAVEYGTMPAETEPSEGGQHGEITISLDYIVNTNPVPDMLSEVRANMRKLRDALTALNLNDPS